jgi:hypothetical protein
MVLLIYNSPSRNSVYILAVIEDDEFQFEIGEIDTHSNQSDLRLKSFHILNYKISAIVSYLS